MKINTEYLEKCIEVLNRSYELLNGSVNESVDYEMYRNSLIKSFEMTLEQSGKLLLKKLSPYMASKSAADALTYKDIFRYAHKRSLLSEDEVKRWLKYRDNRNNTVHNYGKSFAEDTLTLMDTFIADARRLKEIIGSD